MRLVTLAGLQHVCGLHFTPDGQRLLAVGGEMLKHIDQARWVDVAEGRETLQIPLFASCYAVSPNLSRLAVGLRRLREPHPANVPPLVIIDATDSTWMEDETRRERVGMTVLEREEGTHINAIAFDPTGERLAIATTFTQYVGGHIALWYMQVLALDCDEELLLTTTDRATYDISWTRDGTAVLTNGAIRKAAVAMWDANTLDLGCSYAPPTPQPRQPVFSPEGGTVAVPNASAVYLLPADLSAPRIVLQHSKHGVECVAFTPDGRRLLTTSYDKLVRTWDITSGELLTSYDFGIGGTSAVAVAPDGLTAAVAGQRGQIMLFDLDE